MSYEVRNGVNKILLSLCGYGLILATKEENLLHIEPKKCYGEGSEKKKENGSLQAEAKEGESFGTKGLATNWFHSHS